MAYHVLLTCFGWSFLLNQSACSDQSASQEGGTVLHVLECEPHHNSCETSSEYKWIHKFNEASVEGGGICGSLVTSFFAGLFMPLT